MTYLSWASKTFAFAMSILSKSSPKSSSQGMSGSGPSRVTHATWPFEVGVAVQ